MSAQDSSVLMNQPDFAAVKSELEMVCAEKSVEILFLPKFHCELNPIEMCWGYAKKIYRLNPESSSEEDLERNALAALDIIPIGCMRQFVNRSLQFRDAYRRGLDGCQAAWACRKYRSYRVLPENIMTELDKAGMLQGGSDLD